MSRISIPRCPKRSGTLFFLSLSLVFILLLVSFLSACSSLTTISKASTLPPTTTTTTAVLTSNTASTAKPTGELVVGITSFGNENFLPWRADASSSEIGCILYDSLIYYDVINRKFLPGLAESWNLAPDALALTYHLRKGVQFQDGWGEFTSEDVKYNFERHAAKNSVGKTTATRNITSMDTPDPYTLVLHYRNPAPSFFMEISLGSGGTCQGIACKKYIETIGEEVAAQKPIGTGPYKMMEAMLGSYYMFEAQNSHWRVVPEFKTLILRMIPETATLIAMLKNKEIDLAQIPAEQIADLKSAGVATEVNPVGGTIIEVNWGGIVIPADSRYDANYHNKDPWVDMQVRQAMTISIDREAICNAVFAGAATPAGVPIISANMGKYQYAYNTSKAKQLLAEAGYPDGFSFNAIAYTVPGVPEMARVMEALVSYWQQIGLDPKIIVSDYASYNQKRTQLKTAGDISLLRCVDVADEMNQVSLHLMPGGMVVYYQDEESYALYKEGVAKFDADERAAYIDKLNQYYFEHYGPIPIVRLSTCFGWNSAKVSPFIHSSQTPNYFEYVRHTQPLNTFRLFTPMPGR